MFKNLITAEFEKAESLLNDMYIWHMPSVPRTIQYCRRMVYILGELNSTDESEKEYFRTMEKKYYYLSSKSILPKNWLFRRDAFRRIITNIIDITKSCVYSYDDVYNAQHRPRLLACIIAFEKFLPAFFQYVKTHSILHVPIGWNTEVHERGYQYLTDLEYCIDQWSYYKLPIFALMRQKGIQHMCTVHLEIQQEAPKPQLVSCLASNIMRRSMEFVC